MRTLTTIAALLLAASEVCGQLRLDGPAEAEKGRSFEVTVEGANLELDDFSRRDPPQMQWLVVPEQEERPRSRYELIFHDGKWTVSPYCTVTCDRPGTAGVVFLLVRDGLGELLSHEVDVKGADDGDDDDDDPDPPPPVEELWGAILVYESALEEEPTEEDLRIARLLSDVELLKWFSGLGLKFHRNDQHNKDPFGAQIKPEYIARARAHGLPALMVVTEGGRVPYTGDVPGAEGIKALITDLVKGGKALWPEDRPQPRRAPAREVLPLPAPLPLPTDGSKRSATGPANTGSLRRFYSLWRGEFGRLTSSPSNSERIPY